MKKRAKRKTKNKIGVSVIIFYFTSYFTARRKSRICAQILGITKKVLTKNHFFVRLIFHPDHLPPELHRKGITGFLYCKKCHRLFQHPSRQGGIHISPLLFQNRSGRL